MSSICPARHHHGGPPHYRVCEARQSDSQFQSLPGRRRCNGDGKARAHWVAILAVEVLWLRMQSRFICCQPRIHQGARGFTTPPCPSSSPRRGLVEHQSRSTPNSGIAMLYASRTTKSGGIAVCWWMKRPGVRVLVFKAPSSSLGLGSRYLKPGPQDRDVDGGRRPEQSSAGHPVSAVLNSAGGR